MIQFKKFMNCVCHILARNVGDFFYKSARLPE